MFWLFQWHVSFDRYMKYCWVCPKLFPESWQEVTSEATNLKASLAGLKYKSDRAQTAQAFREAKKLPSCRKRWKRWTGGLTGFEVDIYIYIYICIVVLPWSHAAVLSR